MRTGIKAVIISAVVMVSLLSVQEVLATSENVQEKCAVKTKDGHWLELDRPNNVTLNDGRVIIGYNCEQLQQAWANTTYAEYEQSIRDTNEARERVAERFMPQPSLSEQLRELNEKLDKLGN